MKTVYNTAAKATPILSKHWRKFERWIRDIVLHQGSDKLKLSAEFTVARQKLSEDPNQFYIRLFNLGILSDRSVTTEDYRTRLLKPLRILMDQQDREYHTIQDVVTHAGKLWQTLDQDKLRQDLKEAKERARQRHRDSKPPRSSRDGNDNSQSRRLPDRTRSSRKPQRDSSKDTKPTSRSQLSNEERQHRMENRLCYNCGYPGHGAKNCSHPFNPNRVALRSDKDKTKSQPTRTSQKRARVQPTRAETPSDHNVHTTDKSESSESESDRPAKQSKN